MGGSNGGSRLTSRQMGDEERQRDRADRNRDRSEEAHWQAAEAGAEEDDRPPEPAEEDGDDESPQD